MLTLAPHISSAKCALKTPARLQSSGHTEYQCWLTKHPRQIFFELDPDVRVQHFFYKLAAELERSDREQQECVDKVTHGSVDYVTVRIQQPLLEQLNSNRLAYPVALGTSQCKEQPITDWRQDLNVEQSHVGDFWGRKKQRSQVYTLWTGAQKSKFQSWHEFTCLETLQLE